MEEYDQVAEDYDSTYQDKLSQAENQAVKHFLKEHNCDQGRILDLGCGTGLLYELIGGNGNLRYYGLDTSSCMLSKLLHKHRHLEATIWLRSAEDVNFPNAEFDHTVCLWGALNYCDFERGYKSAMEQLVVGGKLFAVLYSEHHKGSEALHRAGIPSQHNYFEREFLDKFFDSVTGLTNFKFDQNKDILEKYSVEGLTEMLIEEAMSPLCQDVFDYKYYICVKEKKNG